MKMFKVLSMLLVIMSVMSGPVQADTVTYIHTDMLGTPVAATDESGNVIWREHYSPFGKKLVNSAESQRNNVGFTGHQFDSDTGLTYMQARYYDPVIGRFYSNDPVGFKGVHSFNRYAYANNNPYKYIDPDGRETMMARLADIDVRALGDGSISKKQFAARQSNRVQGSRIALQANPIGRVVLAAISGAEVVLNEISDTENKGQTKPEVGDCPTCGGETSNKPGKIGAAHGLKPKEVKEKIHGLKSGNKLAGNPDVEVCNSCGEVHPQSGQGLGDSIGNIEE